MGKGSGVMTSRPAAKILPSFNAVTRSSWKSDTDDGDNHTDDVPNDDYVVVVDQAPHLGSATLQTRGKMMTMTVDNILSGGT